MIQQFNISKYLKENKIITGLHKTAKKKQVTESLSKASLSGIDNETLNDIKDGYYAIGDALQGQMRYGYMQAAHDNKDWKPEYDKFKKLMDIFNKMETGKVL